MAVVAVVGLCTAAGSAPVQAAVTTGRVFGHAPAGATVLVSNPDLGIQRRITANANGRYEVTWLRPVGAYTVTVVEGNRPLARHPDVTVLVDHGSRVDFSCANVECSELASN